MKALIVADKGRTAVTDIPEPGLDAGEVMIRVEHVGICGSDMHIYTGMHEFRKPPVVLGHELTGRIERLGPGAAEFKVGDLVTVMPQYGCGVCEPCKRDRPMQCRARVVPGTDQWVGAFVEHFNAPEAVVFKLPDSVDSKTGVLAEPLAVAVHATGKISPENRKRLVILGVGSIGMLSLVAAKKLGFEKILVTDISDYNLQLAKKLGADVAVNVANDDAAKAAATLFEGEGADAVVLTAGGEASMQQAIDLAGAGGEIVYLAMITHPVTLQTRPVVARELKFIGSRTYNHADFQKAVDLLAADPDLFRPLVTHCLPASEVQDAFELIDTRREGFVKIALDMSR